MNTAIATRLKGALSMLWAQLDVEKDCLPSKSCRWLLEELRELQEIPVPAGYASSALSLAAAAEALQATLYSPIASLSLADAATLSSLLTSAVTILTAPLPPSSANDPSQPTLPSEVISLIFHQLAAEKDTSDLPACCLVSKSFLPLAREALYHTLYLTADDEERDEEGDLLDLPSSARRGSDFAINYGRLATELAFHPHLGSLVRRLEVSFDNVEHGMDHASALDVFRALLDACRPHHVKLEGAESTEASHFARVLCQSRQRFRSLHLGTFSNSERRSIDAALWRLLQEQDTLEDLALEFDDSMEAEALIGCPFTLKQLQIDSYRHNFLIAPLLDSLLHHSAATLTRLSFPLDLSLEPYTTPRLSHFVNLQELELSLESEKPPGDPAVSRERGRCDGLLSVLPPSVQSMTVGGPSARSLPLLVPLDRLPTTLFSLHIRAIHFPPAALLTFLRSRSFPHLRRLQYSVMEFKDNKLTEWTSTSKEEVESLLKELGIEGN
ncbi:hypothetical protein BCR35DRAFT_305472 [Leucosporidium creatinivorum]|uniref:F-box domain-containing protein n=1 Tax=Leucosporidium creatinivorum TaxID=106004 RepID=A0A1Y2F045_9BASI|nr:hypothetical protein BCR35DRAFT_305472 [Leucosporidium creatinivorum]